MPNSRNTLPCELMNRQPQVAMTASGFDCSASTCLASFVGSHSSSASRKATNSPRAAAMPSFMAPLSP